MSKDLFYCQDGSLTDYALSCDYVHRLRVKNNTEWIELKKEYSTYIVDRFNFKTGRKNFEYIYPQGFESLIKAKKFYFNECKKHYGLTKKQVIRQTTHQL